MNRIDLPSHLLNLYDSKYQLLRKIVRCEYITAFDRTFLSDFSKKQFLKTEATFLS